jgi:hypothetical protein
MAPANREQGGNEHAIGAYHRVPERRTDAEPDIDFGAGAALLV